MFHKGKMLTAEEVMNNRSSKYKFLNFEKMQVTTTVYLSGIELEAVGVYTPEEQEIRYHDDMSGTPFSPAEFDVNEVWAGGVDIYDLLSEEQLNNIVEQVLNRQE